MVFSEELGIVIPNIDETRSRRNYNRYLLAYETVTGKLNKCHYTTVLKFHIIRKQKAPSKKNLGGV